MENAENSLAYILSFVLTVTTIGAVVLKAGNSEEVFASLGILLQASLILAGVLVAIMLIWYIYNWNSLENQSVKLLKRYSREGFSEIQFIDNTVPGKRYFMLKSDKFEKKVSISRYGKIVEYPDMD